MEIINTLNKNGVVFQSVENELFPIAMQCPYCEDTICGNPSATFNIDEYGYGYCSACNKNTDWNMLLEKLGISTYKEEVFPKRPKTKWDNKKTQPSKKGKVMIKCLNDIKSVPISWLWESRIALGKLTMIAGDPGLGKSLLTATLAAHVSKGFPWPVDSTKPLIGDVILLSAEDDAADTIKPRLEAMDADCSRIHIIESIQETNDEDETSTHRMFSFKQDVSKLAEQLDKLPNCSLVVIDPVSAYLDSADSNNNSDIRGLLAPLAELASKNKIAVVLISHLNKNSSGNASYRVMGSLAFTAAVRSAYIVTKDKEKPERRLLMPLKNNIAKDTTGLAYSIIEINGAPVIAWEDDPVEMTVEEALAPTESKEEYSLTDIAIDFLLDFLSKGPVRVDEVHKEARKAGITQKPLRSAYDKLKVTSKKIGYNPGYWMWILPEDALNTEDALSKGEGNIDEVGHVQDIKLNNLEDIANYLNPDRNKKEVKNKNSKETQEKTPNQEKMF